MAELSRSVAYRPEEADGSQGYLVFQGTPEEYRERIAACPYSVVAVDAKGAATGYLLASYRDAHGVEREGYLLVDQICVGPAARGGGLAQRMLDRVTAEAGGRTVGAAIMHAPVRNERSLRFFTEKNGFRLVREFPEGNFRWGYYEREY
jgi:ribosomal protein S18 acetylase RimI-like enzyme